MILFEIFYLLILVIFGINVVYFFFFSIAGKLGAKKVIPLPDNHKKFLLLIPAYKEDVVILETAEDALKQNYPKDKYQVTVIADKLQPATIQKLKAIPVNVIEVNFEVSTKIKSLNFAVNSVQERFDAVAILDSDNLMERDFLKKMNRELCAGYKAVQAHRIAKNEDTHIAFLDAMSEEINNHLFRKGHYLAGLSSALIGSAMAFDFQYFKNKIKDIHSVGEDKELELLILKDKEKIVFADDALVYDEKVSNLDVFGNQRKRWLSSQLNIFSNYFLPSFKELFLHGNFDYFNKAFQSSLIPRVLLLGFLFLFSIANLIFPFFWFSNAFLFLFLLYVVTLLIAIPGRFYSKRLISAALHVPSVFLKMFMIQFKLKGVSKTFTHTPHTVVNSKSPS